MVSPAFLAPSAVEEETKETMVKTPLTVMVLPVGSAMLPFVMTVFQSSAPARL